MIGEALVVLGCMLIGACVFALGFHYGRSTNIAILMAADRVLDAAKTLNDIGDQLGSMDETIRLQGRILDGQGQILQSLVDELREFRLRIHVGAGFPDGIQVGEDTDSFRANNRAVASSRDRGHQQV